MPTDTFLDGSNSELGRTQGDKPSDTEALPGDTAASRPLSEEQRRAQPSEADARADSTGTPPQRERDE